MAEWCSAETRVSGSTETNEGVSMKNEEKLDRLIDDTAQRMGELIEQGDEQGAQALCEWLFKEMDKYL